MAGNTSSVRFLNTLERAIHFQCGNVLDISGASRKYMQKDITGPRVYTVLDYTRMPLGKIGYLSPRRRDDDFSIPRYLAPSRKTTCLELDWRESNRGIASGHTIIISRL